MPNIPERSPLLMAYHEHRAALLGLSAGAKALARALATVDGPLAQTVFDLARERERRTHEAYRAAWDQQRREAEEAERFRVRGGADSGAD